MEFKIDRDILLDGITSVHHVIEKISSRPILSNIYIEAKDGKLELMSTDINIAARNFVPAEIIVPGAITTNARKLMEILENMPQSEVHCTVDENLWVNLTCRKTEFHIAGMDAAEFPDFPEFPISDDEMMVLPREALLDLIDRTSFAISVDPLRPILCSTKINASNNRITAVVTDGYRLAHCTHLIDDNLDFSVLIPSKVTKMLQKVLPNAEEELLFYQEADHIYFKCEEFSAFSRQFTGQYPNYESVFPKDYAIIVQFEKEEVQKVMKRMSLIASESTFGVLVESRDNMMYFYTENPVLGDARDEIAIQKQGPDFILAYNPKLFNDILAAVKGDRIYMKLDSPPKAAIFTSDEDENFFGLLMPLREVNPEVESVVDRFESEQSQDDNNQVQDPSEEGEES